MLVLVLGVLLGLVLVPMLVLVLVLLVCVTLYLCVLRQACFLENAHNLAAQTATAGAEGNTAAEGMLTAEQCGITRRSAGKPYLRNRGLLCRRGAVRFVPFPIRLLSIVLITATFSRCWVRLLLRMVFLLLLSVSSPHPGDASGMTPSESRAGGTPTNVLVRCVSFIGTSRSVPWEAVCNSVQPAPPNFVSCSGIPGPE